jgi:hypothetical protein
MWWPLSIRSPGRDTRRLLGCWSAPPTRFLDSSRLPQLGDAEEAGPGPVPETLRRRGVPCCRDMAMSSARAGARGVGGGCSSDGDDGSKQSSAAAACCAAAAAIRDERGAAPRAGLGGGDSQQLLASSWGLLVGVWLNTIGSGRLESRMPPGLMWYSAWIEGVIVSFELVIPRQQRVYRAQRPHTG